MFFSHHNTQNLRKIVFWWLKVQYIVISTTIATLSQFLVTIQVDIKSCLSHRVISDQSPTLYRCLILAAGQQMHQDQNLAFLSKYFAFNGSFRFPINCPEWRLTASIIINYVMSEAKQGGRFCLGALGHIYDWFYDQVLTIGSWLINNFPHGTGQFFVYFFP